MIKTIGCSTDRELGAKGYESLTVGFANVLYAAKSGLVMDRLPGRTLAEADLHKGDARLLGAVADLLARCHELPTPQPFREGVPLLWREIDKMMDVVARRPELIPKDMPDIEGITAEINVMKVALDKHKPRVTFCHGSMNPRNVLLSSDGSVKFIDWELGGPNYRGFDLMKLFRTSGASSERCMEYFLRVYAASIGELQCKDDVSTLLREVRMFEPLTWLEAVVFFLVMPQFKPEGVMKWNELAIHGWSKFKETKFRLAED